MPTVIFPDGGHDGGGLARFDDGHDLIGLGTSEVAIHEVIAPAWGIFLNGYTPFLGAVLGPVVVLRSDVAQHLPTDGIDLAIGPEKADGPLFLLKGLDRGMEQDTIEATIIETDVILNGVRRRRSWGPPESEIPGGESLLLDPGERPWIWRHQQSHNFTGRSQPLAQRLCVCHSGFGLLTPDFHIPQGYQGRSPCLVRRLVTSGRDCLHWGSGVRCSASDGFLLDHWPYHLALPRVGKTRWRRDGCGLRSRRPYTRSSRRTEIPS